MEEQKIFYIDKTFNSYKEIENCLNNYESKEKYCFIVDHSKTLKQTYENDKSVIYNEKLVYEDIYHRCSTVKPTDKNNENRCRATLIIRTVKITKKSKEKPEEKLTKIDQLRITEYKGEHNHDPLEKIPKRRRKAAAAKVMADDDDAEGPSCKKIPRTKQVLTPDIFCQPSTSQESTVELSTLERSSTPDIPCQPSTSEESTVQLSTLERSSTPDIPCQPSTSEEPTDGLSISERTPTNKSTLIMENLFSWNELYLCVENNQNNLIVSPHSEPVTEKNEQAKAKEIIDAFGNKCDKKNKSDKENQKKIVILPIMESAVEKGKKKEKAKRAIGLHRKTTVEVMKKKCEFKQLTVDVQIKKIIKWLKLDITEEFIRKKKKVTMTEIKHINIDNLPDEITSCNLNVLKDLFEIDALNFLKSLSDRKEKKIKTYKCAECQKRLKTPSVCCDGCLIWFDQKCIGINQIPEGSWFCKNCNN